MFSSASPLISHSSYSTLNPCECFYIRRVEKPWNFMLYARFCATDRCHTIFVASKMTWVFNNLCALICFWHLQRTAICIGFIYISLYSREYWRVIMWFGCKRFSSLRFSFFTHLYASHDDWI